jgi:hypothetical protein
MSSIDVLGYAAALAVLSSFCMSAIVPLRILAVVSNLLFGLYGVLAYLYPVFFLHSILLPINLFKLARCQSSAGPRNVFSFAARPRQADEQSRMGRDGPSSRTPRQPLGPLQDRARPTFVHSPLGSRQQGRENSLCYVSGFTDSTVIRA